MGVVMGKDEKVNIPHLYMKLAMDLEKLQNYPWGMYSFDFLLKQIDKTRHKLEQKEGYLMEGFLFGFQIDRSESTWSIQSVDRDHYAEQTKNAQYILIDLFQYARSAKLDRV